MIGASKLISASVAHSTVSPPSTTYGFSVLEFLVNANIASIITDSENNVIACGAEGSAGFVLKYNSQRELIWAKKWPTNMAILGLTVDSLNNIYVCGQYSINGSTGNSTGFFQKLSPEGVALFGGQQWITNTFTAYRAIKLDSLGNIWVSGYTTADGVGSYDILLTKYSSAGSILLTKTIGTSSIDANFGMSISSSNLISLVGYTNSGSYGYSSLAIALNSNAVLAWSKSVNYTTNTNFDFFFSSVVDSSGNIYMIGDTTIATGSARALLVKISSSGALQWTRLLQQDGKAQNAGYSVSLDPLGNLLVSGYSYSSVPNESFLVTFDTNGNKLSYQKKLSASSSVSPTSSYVDSSGDFYAIIDNYLNPATNIIIAKLPSNGDGNGVYGPITYSDVTIFSTSYTGTIFGNQSVVVANAVMSSAGFAPALTDLTVPETFYPLTV